jgi:hypothetical protein
MTEKTTTHTDSADSPGEYNPWTANLKGWAKHIRASGDLLPKQLLRPYWLLPPVRIDDKQYVYPDGGDLKSALGMIYGFAYIIAAGAGLGWIVTGFAETNALLVTLICLAVALPIHSYAQKLEHNRYSIFDREKGIVISESGWFKKKERILPFHECEGRLHRQAHGLGMIHFTLHLKHPSMAGYIRLMSTSTIDEPLGYWSFLVQYMDTSKPLPDIPLLENFPVREPGLGSPEDWEKLEKQPDFLDPFAYWLAELEAHPEWDKVNYGRDFSQAWKPVLAFILVILAFLFFILYIMTVLTT